MLTPTSDLSVGRRRWIDALLLGAGVWSLVAGWPYVGLSLLALAVVMPAVHWVARKRSGIPEVARLVPADLAANYCQVLEAARLPGVVDPAEVVEAADDALYEVAALLAGRPPRGAAQRRFVAARVNAMTETALALRDRHEAWLAARAEVRAISSLVLPDPDTTEHSDWLATSLAVALFPCFLTWDLLRALAHGTIALFDGLALRVRTVGTLGMRAGRVVVVLLGRAWGAWRRTTVRLKAAFADARHRVDTMRLRARLQLRRARLRVRRVRTS